MNIRIKPNIYLFIGYVSWFFFSLFYTTIYFTSQSFHGTLNGTFYLFLLGIFCFSFYKYYDLTLIKVSRDDIFNTLFRLFILGIKCFFRIIFTYLFILLMINFGFFNMIIDSLLINLTIGSSTIFLIITYLISYRLISFDHQNYEDYIERFELWVGFYVYF